ncbi:hypothetical protein O1L60_03370 [Streptomyces diastatochromogenes]|nr:hypothetical protein [Streptomyces diastatochromogenes]
MTVLLALLALAGLGAGFWLLGDTLALPATAPYDPAELRLAHRCGQALAAGVVAATGLVLLAVLRRVDVDGAPPVPARRALRRGRRRPARRRARGALYRGPRSRDILMSSNLAYADVERSTW